MTGATTAGATATGATTGTLSPEAEPASAGGVAGAGSGAGVAGTGTTGIGANAAVARRSPVRSSVQVAAVPVQAPLQPVNVEPGAATAVSVTVAPLTRLAWHVAPQAMPAAASLVTEPLPVVTTCRSRVDGEDRGGAAVGRHHERAGRLPCRCRRPSSP